MVCIFSFNIRYATCHYVNCGALMLCLHRSIQKRHTSTAQSNQHSNKWSNTCSKRQTLSASHHYPKMKQPQKGEAKQRTAPHHSLQQCYSSSGLQTGASARYFQTSPEACHRIWMCAKPNEKLPAVGKEGCRKDKARYSQCIYLEREQERKRWFVAHWEKFLVCYFESTGIEKRYKRTHSHAMFPLWSYHNCRGLIESCPQNPHTPNSNTCWETINVLSKLHGCTVQNRIELAVHGSPAMTSEDATTLPGKRFAQHRRSLTVTTDNHPFNSHCHAPGKRGADQPREITSNIPSDNLLVRLK